MAEVRSPRRAETVFDRLLKPGPFDRLQKIMRGSEVESLEGKAAEGSDEDDRRRGWQHPHALRQ
jgi:hypothetical protein